MILLLSCKPWHHWRITKAISRQCKSKNEEMLYMRNLFFAVSHKHWITEACGSNSVGPFVRSDSHLNCWFLSFGRFFLYCAVVIFRGFTCTVVNCVMGLNHQIYVCTTSLAHLVSHGEICGHAKSERSAKWCIGIMSFLKSQSALEHFIEDWTFTCVRVTLFSLILFISVSCLSPCPLFAFSRLTCSFFFHPTNQFLSFHESLLSALSI